MNSGHFAGCLAQGNLPLSTIAPADVHAMAGEEFGRGIDDDVKSVLDRPKQGRREDGVCR